MLKIIPFWTLSFEIPFHWEASLLIGGSCQGRLEAAKRFVGQNDGLYMAMCSFVWLESRTESLGSI